MSYIVGNLQISKTYGTIIVYNNNMITHDYLDFHDDIHKSLDLDIKVFPTFEECINNNLIKLDKDNNSEVIKLLSNNKINLCIFIRDSIEQEFYKKHGIIPNIEVNDVCIW